MAIIHIPFQMTSTHGHFIRSALDLLENGRNQLGQLLGSMAMMINGDGTNVTHFTQYIIDHFGFPDAATAKAAWDELNSLNFKLTTNASVTAVNDAMVQAFNKFR